MNRKTLIILGAIIGFVALSAGIMGGIYYKGANNLEINMEKVTITSFSIGGTIFSPTIDVSLNIDANVSQPTALPISVTYANFEVYIDGDYYGIGQAQDFVARPQPSDFIVCVLLDDMNEEAFDVLYDLLVLGHAKTITIKITTVKAMGIKFELNQEQDFLITQEDILTS